MIHIYVNKKYWGEVTSERASMLASFLKFQGWGVVEDWFKGKVYVERMTKKGDKT